MKSKMILCIALLVGFTLGSPAQESREVNKTVPLPKDGQVSIDTYKGSVNVDTWEKAEVSITARILADRKSVV